jgi:hypothetical protein
MLMSEVDLQAIIEHDRAQVAAGVTAIQKILKNYSWLMDGRGSYEWDDDRWHSEFRFAVENIEKELEPLVKIAGDWSNCSRDWKAVDAARELISREQAVAIVKKNFENSWWQTVDACIEQIRSAMNGTTREWMDRNYRWLMLAGMGIELALIAVLVVLEAVMLLKVMR